MNIYHVDRSDKVDYDEYDSFVCYAKDEEQARNLHPSSDSPDWDDHYGSWVRRDKIDKLTVTLLGSNDTVTESKVILASFNAG